MQRFAAAAAAAAALFFGAAVVTSQEVKPSGKMINGGTVSRHPHAECEGKLLNF